MKPGLPAFTQWTKAVIAFALMVVFGNAALPVARDALAMEPIRPDQESSLIRAVFADGHLWLLSDAGQLSAIAENGSDRTPYDLSTPVLDLCTSDGHPMIITGGSDRTWALRRWTNHAWPAVRRISSEGDELAALSCSAEATTLLTSKRLIEIGLDGRLHTVKLKEKLHPGIVTAIYRKGDHVFVSINGGEWGGGLQRIDERAGTIVSIERNESGKLCGGPLNSSCDPVHGIAVEPWNPRCLAVAVGLIHMMMNGSIIEICGENIRPLYTKAYVSQSWGAMLKGKKPPPETMAFFGITSSDDSLWAVGTDGLYRIDSSGKATITPLPDFETIDHIKVSFKHPKLILVMTDANQRRSLSGSVPMLVPR